MKKILFFVCLAMVMVGCDWGKDKNPEKPIVTNEEESNGITEDKDDKYQRLTRSFIPNAIVPIDKAKADAFSSSDIALGKWADKYGEYIVLKTTDTYYVDLDMVNTKDTIGVWMKKFDILINFTKFYTTIELRHAVLSQNTDDYAQVTTSGLPSKTTTYNDLKLMLKSSSVNVNTDDNYDDLFIVDISSTNLRVNKHGYLFEDAVFSVPLINAIVQNHGLTNPSIVFSKTNATPTIPSVTFFKVSDTVTGFVGYFDYSQRPPVKKHAPKYIF